MEIPLRDGTAQVDDADGPLIAPFRWRSIRVGRRVYAYTTVAGRTTYMHNLILNRKTQGRGRGDVDHINGDGLNNRRSNLRLASRQQNNANTGSRRGTSRFKGVSLDRKRDVWQVHIMVNYKSRYLGSYESEEDAARAYDSAAAVEFGQFARLNFPDRLNEPPPVRYAAKAAPRAVIPPSPTASSTGVKQGARNGRAKLTDDDVRRIIAELQVTPRRTYAEIAGEFGVSIGPIANIARRKSWAHLWDS